MLTLFFTQGKSLQEAKGSTASAGTRKASRVV